MEALARLSDDSLRHLDDSLHHSEAYLRWRKTSSECREIASEWREITSECLFFRSLIKPESIRVDQQEFGSCQVQIFAHTHQDMLKSSRRLVL
jgi:hypothetical protein